MKKQLLLPFLFLFLLLLGCQEPDDDVDFPEPEPQERVNELIQGKWLSSSDSAIYYFDDLNIDSIDDDGIFVVPETYAELSDNGEYILTKSAGRTYIELADDSKYVITSISDATMTWEKESGTGPVNINFIRQEADVDPQASTSELLQGKWYELPDRPNTFPDTYSFSDDGYFTIYNEAYGEGVELNYSVYGDYIDYYELYPPEDEDGETYTATYTFEIIDISDKKMTLKNLYDNSDPDHFSIIEFIRK